MEVSPACLAIIRKYEGYSPRRYRNHGGIELIGFGHVIQPDDTFGDTISHHQAEALLWEDARRVGETVLWMVNVPLTQHQFDALVSYAFHWGDDRDFLEIIAGEPLIKKINQRDANVVREFLSWYTITVDGKLVPSPELIKRRAEEAVLFITP